MWRRHVRVGAAIVAVATVAAVVYLMRPREVRRPAAPLERVDPAALIETRGCDVVQLRGSTRDLRVECETQATYEGGRTRLGGVRLTVDNRAGRQFVVTGREAGVGPDRSTFDLTGDVRLEASDGLVATAGQASYSEADGLVRAPGPVAFRRGGLNGTGVGFTFDQQRDSAWLLDRALVRFEADTAAGESPMEVSAGAAGLARRERYLRFERSVRMVRAGQVMEADEGMVYLFADRDQPDRIELRGNARITGGDGMGALRTLRARDINLDYADDGRTLQQAALAGEALVDLGGEATGESGPQQLSAGFVAIDLADDGAIRSLSAREEVTLLLQPGRPGDPVRTVRAQQLGGSGVPGRGLTAMRFDERVEYREAPAKGAARIGRSATLDASLDPATGALDVARFAGGVRFEDGALRTRSGRATYRVADGVLALRDRDGTAAPTVSDDAIRIEGETIDVTLSPRRMNATGAVRSVLQPAPAAPGARPGRRPALLSADEPLNVVADAMTYDEATRAGTYTGRARLWQGETVIQADAIALDETGGDLRADGNVMTTLVLEDADASGRPLTPTILRSRTFTYDDETRRAVCDTAARMVGQHGDLRADRIELRLRAGEHALDRLDARGGVELRLDRRQASGGALVFYPEAGRYEITGTPGRFVDECNESAGRTLTFFRSSDRLVIDGNEEVRTETRGGRCPGHPAR